MTAGACACGLLDRSASVDRNGEVSRKHAAHRPEPVMIINAMFIFKRQSSSFDPTNCNRVPSKRRSSKTPSITWSISTTTYSRTTSPSISRSVGARLTANRGRRWHEQRASAVESYADVLKALTTGAHPVVQKSADCMLPTVGDLPLHR